MSETRTRHRELLNQKNAVTEKLDALKKARTDALIAGTTFDGSDEIAKLTETSTALDEAIETTDRISTDEEDRAHLAWRADKKDEAIETIGKMVDAYVGTTKLVERAALDLAAGLGDLHQLALSMESFVLSNHLSEVSEVRPTNVSMRMSERLGRALSKFRGSVPGVYGRFQWMPEQPRAEDWVVEEKSILSNVLAHIVRRLKDEAAELREKAATE
ncbi:hypothetical protein [Rhizobium mongolense]